MISPELYLHQINQAVSSEDQEAILSTIPADSDFWVGVYYSSQVELQYAYDLSFDDPKTYSSVPPNPGVFEKLMDILISGSLSLGTLVGGLSFFAEHCTQECWEAFYKPIFERSLRVDFSLELFNKHAPEQWVISLVQVPPFQSDFDRFKSFKNEFVVEPIESLTRIRVVVSDKITIGTQSGVPSNIFDEWVPRLEPLIGKFQGNLTLDFYVTEPVLVLRDVSLDTMEFLPARRKLLERVIFDLDNPNIIEVEYNEVSQANPIEVKKAISLIIEQGYDGFVFRHIDKTFDSNDDIAFILSDETQELICEDIIDRDGDVALVGIGLNRLEPFKNIVSHGLKISTKSQLLKEKESYRGKPFEVVSCGREGTGRLVFPVFKNWKGE